MAAIADILNAIIQRRGSATPCSDILGRLDVRDFGWAAPNSEAQNAAAVTAAMAALPQIPGSGTPAGAVLLPAGTFACGPVSQPQFVVVRGAAKRATILTHTNVAGEVWWNIGGTSVNLYHGCGLSDLTFQLTGNAGTIVQAQGTLGGEFARLYLEGETQTIPRTTFGLVIDGSNASSFFNRISDVDVAHLHTSIYHTTSGAQQPTINYFTNCQGTGDGGVEEGIDTTSIGILIGGGSIPNVGQTSVYTACNFENCGTGAHFLSNAGPGIFIETHFEGNATQDILYDAGAKTQLWIGGLLTTVTDNCSPSAHQYIGSCDGTNVLNGFNRTVQKPILVSSLPAASTVVGGMRMFVSDATVTTFASIVSGGGGNAVPVYSDGTNWRIG